MPTPPSPSRRATTSAFAGGKSITLPQLPSMRCDQGCGGCCGVVMVSPLEFVRITRSITARGLKPVKQGVQCPLYINGTCSIYEARPIPCRMFGHMPTSDPSHGRIHGCTRGYDTPTDAPTWGAWITASAAESRRSGGNDKMRFLHELVYTRPEVEAIIAQASEDIANGRDPLRPTMAGPAPEPAA